MAIQDTGNAGTAAATFTPSEREAIRRTYCYEQLNEQVVKKIQAHRAAFLRELKALFEKYAVTVEEDPGDDEFRGAGFSLAIDDIAEIDVKSLSKELAQLD